jgi:hypothetical protein
MGNKCGGTHLKRGSGNDLPRITAVVPVESFRLAAPEITAREPELVVIPGCATPDCASTTLEQDKTGVRLVKDSRKSERQHLVITLDEKYVLLLQALSVATIVRRNHYRDTSRVLVFQSVCRSHVVAYHMKSLTPIPQPIVVHPVKTPVRLVTKNIDYRRYVKRRFTDVVFFVTKQAPKPVQKPLPSREPPTLGLPKPTIEKRRLTPLRRTESMMSNTPLSARMDTPISLEMLVTTGLLNAPITPRRFDSPTIRVSAPSKEKKFKAFAALKKKMNKKKQPKMIFFGSNAQYQFGVGDSKCNDNMRVNKKLSTVNCSKIASCNITLLLVDGQVYGYGYNYNGELGLGHNKAVKTPQPLTIGRARDISVGLDHTLVLTCKFF